LTANTHTLGLLSAEAEAETSLLEQEMEELHSLEKDLAALEEADEKEKGRLHPFARDVGPDKSRALTAEFEIRPTIKRPAAMGFDIERDPEAKGILEQLRHHLDGMQTDIEGTTDVVTALSMTQAALDVFNWRHLREAEYHQVYGVNAT
jgi:CENP-Q, a CENPA-CAD centromere complex subunit